ncbi:MAG: aminoglycoside phosphotransferase family protein [Pseudomonadota bacterium]
MRPEPNFPDIVPHFNLEGEFIRAEPYGFGHINDTFAAYFRKANGESHRYLMQRINQFVFRDIEGLMRNIAAVTAHLRQKIIQAGGDPNRETLTLIPTTEDGAFFRTSDGDCWRTYIFIEDAQAYEMVMSLNQVFNAAKAFGDFQRLLADFPVDKLHETIPGFHHTAKRFGAFAEAVQRDVKNRASTALAEIRFVEERAGDSSIIVDLLLQGILSTRVTHNDTKFNNIMIDNETGKGICVIDLDTVMPGSPLYDFGDAVRYGANTAVEDERDLAKVNIDLEIYDRFVAGYLESARGFLTQEEVKLLSFSAKLMTFECGLRFLTDYLNGDAYYKTHRENHNLDRCRTQFAMVADMESKFDQMEKIVEQYR